MKSRLTNNQLTALKASFKLITLERPAIASVGALLTEPSPPLVRVSAHPTMDGLARTDPENPLMKDLAQRALEITRTFARGLPDELKDLFADGLGVRFVLDPAVSFPAPAILPAMVLALMARLLRDLLVFDLSQPVTVWDLPFFCAAGLDSSGERLVSTGVSRKWAGNACNRIVLLTPDQDRDFQTLSPGAPVCCNPLLATSDLLGYVFHEFTEIVCGLKRHVQDVFEQRLKIFFQVETHREQLKLRTIHMGASENELQAKIEVLSRQHTLLRERLQEVREAKKKGEEFPPIELVSEQVSSIEDRVRESRARERISAIEPPLGFKIEPKIDRHEVDRQMQAKKLFRSLLHHIHPDTKGQEEWFQSYKDNRDDLVVMRAFEGALASELGNDSSSNADPALTTDQKLAAQLKRLFYLKQSLADFTELIEDRKTEIEGLLENTSLGDDQDLLFSLQIQKDSVNRAWASLHFEYFGSARMNR